MRNVQGNGNGKRWLLIALVVLGGFWLVNDSYDDGYRDALVQTAQLCVATDLPPDSHGAPARLLVTVDLHTLTDTLAEQAITGAVGVGLTGDGAELSAATIRRRACDAEIVPVVLGTHREPLDVGRTRRPVTLAIWAALVVRYRHCAFPGCERLR